MKIQANMIQETTFELIKEKGYANVTIQDICQACSITKPTFYKYFSSKDELVLNVCDHIIHNVMTDTYELLKAGSHIEQLYIIFVQLTQHVMDWGYDLYSHVFIANFNENRYSFDVNPTFAKVCRLVIANAQEKGEIKNMSDPAKLLQALAHMYQGYFSNWCIWNGDYPFLEGVLESINTILILDDKFKDVYKKYIEVK